MIPTLLRFAFGSTMLLSFALALAPAPTLTPNLDHADKIAHFVAYLGLGLLGLFAWPRYAVAICLLLLSHGALVEVAQSLTGHRYGDVWDWLADAFGVIAAWVAYRWIATRNRSPRRP